MALSGIAASAQGSKPQPIEIPADVVAKHRIGTRGPIYVSSLTYREGLVGELPPTVLELIVGIDGHVESVGSSREPLFSEFLLAAAETWRYVPFEVGGRPVVARIREAVVVRPVEESRKLNVPFPEIRDWNSLRITLIRTNCYAYCPAYKVEVCGNGSVSFQSRDFGKNGEIQRANISKDDLLKLVGIFRHANYFSLGDGYFSLVTDNPTYTTAISFDAHAKWVMNYVGGDIGMPYGVTEVEMAIDQVVVKQLQKQTRR